MHRLGIELATISTIPLWLYFSIFCHEMSHFIMARKLGFNPHLVRIGLGAKILTFKLFNTLIELNLLPLGGITYISNIAQQGLKYKLLLVYISGPLSNLFLCLFLSLVYKNLLFAKNLEFIEIIRDLAVIELLIFFLILFL